MTGGFNRRDLLGSLFRSRRPSALPVARLDVARPRPTPQRGRLAGVREPTPQHGRFASVRIDQSACLASASMTCSVCFERCPVPGAVVRTAGAAPRIDPDLCTGCGECVTACPAPTMAIRITPRRRGTP